MEPEKDVVGRSRALFTEARELLGNPEHTAEDMQKVERLVTEAKALQAKAVQMSEISDALEIMDKAITEEQTVKKAEVKEIAQAGEFKDLGEMLHAIRVWAVVGKKDPRLNWYDDKDGTIVSEVKDLVENVGASGGFLVPTEFIARMYAVMAETTFVRPRATIIPMRRRQVNIPVLDQTGTTAGVPHWFGGMTFYWAEEATEKTESDPQFRQMSLVAHKLIGYTRASDELVADSAVSLDALLSGDLGMAGGAAWHEEHCFIQGTGAGQPLGVINAGATITVQRQAQNTVGYIDLANMLERHLPTASANSTLWVISQSLRSELMQVQDPAGNYVWQPNARDGNPGLLFGFPVQFSEKPSFRGRAGDVILVDWRYYLIGDRQAVTIESTQFDRWRYDETSWRMVHRVDGQPWLSTELTLQDGSSTISPFVILGDKST